jgi:hypothetical protein
MTIGDAQKTGKSHLYCANPTVAPNRLAPIDNCAKREKKSAKYKQNITDTENSGRIAY